MRVGTCAFSWIPGRVRWWEEAFRSSKASSIRCVAGTAGWGRPARGVRTGRAVTGAANLAFLFLLLTGPLLWIPRPLTRRTLADNLLLRRCARGPGRQLNRHHVIGICSVAPLALISATGVVLSYPAVGDRVYAVVGALMSGGAGAGEDVAQTARLAPVEARGDRVAPGENGGLAGALAAAGRERARVAQDRSRGPAAGRHADSCGGADRSCGTAPEGECGHGGQRQRCRTVSEVLSRRATESPGPGGAPPCPHWRVLGPGRATGGRGLRARHRRDGVDRFLRRAGDVSATPLEASIRGSSPARREAVEQPVAARSAQVFLAASPRRVDGIPRGGMLAATQAVVVPHPGHSLAVAGPVAAVPWAMYTVGARPRREAFSRASWQCCRGGRHGPQCGARYGARGLSAKGLGGQRSSPPRARLPGPNGGWIPASSQLEGLDERTDTAERRDCRACGGDLDSRCACGRGGRAGDTVQQACAYLIEGLEKPNW